jgi:structure-specific recognition protein 1
VPNTEQEANSGEEEKVKEKKPAKGKGSQASQEDEDEGEEEEEQISAAKVLNEKIIKAAGIGQSAGEMIATLPELPMLIPRGKYSFDLYSDFAKLHGRTNDYKILYKDINKCFLLPKPDGIYMAYLL